MFDTGMIRRLPNIGNCCDNDWRLHWVYVKVAATTWIRGM